MPVTDWKYPSTVENVGTGGIWNNTANVVGSGLGETTGDRANATCSYGDLTRILRAKGFGFNLPTGATINGIEVQFRMYATTSYGEASYDNVVQLVVDNSGAGQNKSGLAITPTTITTKTYGGAADKWNLTPTFTQLNSSNFGIQYQGQSEGGQYGDTSTFYVYWVRIRVTYEADEPPPAGGNKTMFFGL